MKPRDRRASRWDAHRRSRRAELTDAAIAAIRAHGAGVGMDDVAAQAATSKTVVYRHFTDRTQLYVAVCARVAEHLLGQVRAAMDAATGPRGKAAAGIEAYLRLIEHDPEVYRFVVHRAPAAGPVTDLVSLIGDEAAEIIAEQLRRVGLDPAPAVPWGHGVVGLVRAAADNWIARPAGMTRTQLATHITDLAWAGLSGVVAPQKEDK
ncbi:TetR family transcriptional regulator [Pseudonocardia nigra]|uniref:TetR family transcriptional regulator n=1 Tax=Pseudonocardia nigra TaxID=1921578 RepID=UPI001C601F1B|nr:TetR family transcriptional regulator [Pseudonocardia nigra]